jgi:threonine dehydrogenase-like Zn-dependent dehydrogenase
MSKSHALMKNAGSGTQNTTMKALVFHGPGRRAWEDKPRPMVKDATDAIVRITTSTICGSDLHILKGDVPTATDGRILGHEGVGVVEDVGKAVSNFHKGASVLISCITACGTCEFCKKGMYSHCKTGGWILGNEIDGTQAEYVRIPHADTSLYALPPGADEESTWRSRPWAFPRPSTSASRSWRRAAVSRTSVSTASPSNCTSRSSGPRTSR